jgi:uroporphyrinogen decarboxylase
LEGFDFIHAWTDARLFFHSCEAIRPVIPHLIEIGFDIINPVQVSATGMDSSELKAECGDEVVFWGGGFVVATVHNIQGNVSPEKFMAVWETLQEFGTNPI